MTVYLNVKHRIRWFVYAGGERYPRESSMRGHWDGYDVECSCGWASKTGGAIKARVEEAVRDHKWDVANGWWAPEGETPPAEAEWQRVLGARQRQKH